MLRCLQRVCSFKVRRLKEVSTHLWVKEQHVTEEEQEASDTNQVLNRTVRVERNRVDDVVFLRVVIVELELRFVIVAH